MLTDSKYHQHVEYISTFMNLITTVKNLNMALSCPP